VEATGKEGRGGKGGRGGSMEEESAGRGLGTGFVVFEGRGF